MANEAKQFTIGGVTHDVMDEGARQLIASLQATIDAITGGDTTTAIKTFQEVIDFLDGVTDDATLVGKLNELRTLINAKYTKPNTGIPASDLADGVIPDISGKVDKVTGKGLSTNDYTDADKAAVGTIGSKANSSDVVKSVSVNGTTQQKDAQGNVDLGVVVKSVTINGNTPSVGSDGNVNLGNVQGQKGDKGDTGNCQITGDGSNIVSLIVNDLTTGGAGNFLSAEMGKRLKDKIDYVYGRMQTLYAAIGNIAFWDGKPSISTLLPPLDWGNPKHTVTVNLSLDGYVAVKHNGTPINNGDTFQVEEFSLFSLGIESTDDTRVLSSVTASAGDVSQDMKTVSLRMGSSDVTLTITVATAQAPSRNISYSLTNCNGVTVPSTITNRATIVVQADATHIMPESLPNGAVTGADVVSYTRSLHNSMATIVIDNPTADVTVAVDAEMLWSLMLGHSIDISLNRYYLNNAGSTSSRATLVVKRDDTGHPCTWGAKHDGSYSQEELDTYSTVPIPEGATKVSFKCSPNYNYGFNLMSGAGIPLLIVEWTAGSTKKEYSLSDYPNATHVVVNLKPTTGNFAGDETYDSMGIEFIFDFNNSSNE